MDKFKCPRHSEEIAFYFCNLHRCNEIMCAKCVNDHIKEVGNLGPQDKPKNVDFQKHEFYNLLPYIRRKMIEGLTIYHKMISLNKKVQKNANYAKNYNDLLEYNMYYVDQAIDKKAAELISMIESYKLKMKKKLRESYEAHKKITFQLDWQKIRGMMAEDYSNCHHSIAGKLTRFKFNVKDIIKNKFEEIDKTQYHYFSDPEMQSFEKTINDAFTQQAYNVYPRFKGVYVDMENIKKAIEKNFFLANVDESCIEFNPVEIMKKDINFLKTKVQIGFLFDKFYNFKLSNILNGGQSQAELVQNDVTILDSDGKVIENNFFRNMILPLGGENLYINEDYYDKMMRPKIISIGGIFNDKNGGQIPNHISVFDIETKTFYQNIYTLNYSERNSNKKFERSGLKCFLTSAEELRPKKNVRDANNLLVFGGNTIDGVQTKEYN